MGNWKLCCADGPVRARHAHAAAQRQGSGGAFTARCQGARSRHGLAGTGKTHLQAPASRSKRRVRTCISCQPCCTTTRMGLGLRHAPRARHAEQMETLSRARLRQGISPRLRDPAISDPCLRARRKEGRRPRRGALDRGQWANADRIRTNAMCKDKETFAAFLSIRGSCCYQDRAVLRGCFGGRGIRGPISSKLDWAQSGSRPERPREVRWAGVAQSHRDVRDAQVAMCQQLLCSGMTQVGSDMSHAGIRVSKRRLEFPCRNTD